MTDAISRSGADLSAWLGYTYSFEGGGEVIAEQVTRTVYDIIDEQVRTAVDAHPYIVNGTFQKPYTLRNRVSFTRFYDKLAWFVNQPAYRLYNSSRTYSYDIHGNVDTLLHRYLVGLMAQPSVNGLGSHLDEFSASMGFKNYKEFTTGRFKPDEILTALKNADNKIHFNLQDFTRWKYLKYAQNPVAPSPALKNITNWELHTIFNNPEILGKTTFYNFVNGSYQVVPKPF